LFPRAQLHEVLETRKLQVSDLADSEIARQVGRPLGLDAIFAGTILEAHTEQWIYAYWRLGVILTARAKFAAQVISSEIGRVVIDQTVSQIRKEDIAGAAELAERESLDQLCARGCGEIHSEDLTPLCYTRSGKGILRWAIEQVATGSPLTGSGQLAACSERWPIFTLIFVNQ
jgi:hypothetical protein